MQGAGIHYIEKTSFSKDSAGMSKNRKQGLTLVRALLKISIVLTDFQQYLCVFCLFGGSTRWHFRVIDCDILVIFLLEYILSRHGLFNRKGPGGSSLIFPLSRAVLYNFIDFGNFLQISSSLLCYKNFPNYRLKFMKSFVLPSKVDCK